MPFSSWFYFEVEWNIERFFADNLAALWLMNAAAITL